MKTVPLTREANGYVEASQQLKAAQQVLKDRRNKLEEAMKKKIEPDEKGNRTIELGDAKLALVPNRHIDESLLKKELGPEAKRFNTRELIVSGHLLRLEFGSDMIPKVEEAVKAAVRKALKTETLPRGVVRTNAKFDLDAAFASLEREEQDRTKVVVSHTLRPYPEKKGFAQKLKDAAKWLIG
jgi:hypothetical protein